MQTWSAAQPLVGWWIPVWFIPTWGFVCAHVMAWRISFALSASLVGFRKCALSSCDHHGIGHRLSKAISTPQTLGDSSRFCVGRCGSAVCTTCHCVQGKSLLVRMCEVLLLPPSRAVGKCTSEDRKVAFWAQGMTRLRWLLACVNQAGWRPVPPMTRHQRVFLILIEYRFTTTSKMDEGRNFKCNPHGTKFTVWQLIVLSSIGPPSVVTKQTSVYHVDYANNFFYCPSLTLFVCSLSV